MKTPTDETYTAFQQAYEFFNQELFDHELPDCLITLQRRKRSFGYFSPQKFHHIKQGCVTDEIAMNPSYFSEGDVEILQTLVHEMTHLWQAHFGKPSRRGYHNKEWARKMENIGLMPSSTGKEGGKKTGQSMADYPINGGKFLVSCDRLLSTGFSIPWGDIPDESEPASSTTGNASNRLKYTCPICFSNIWGKPKLNIVCGDCMQHFVCEEEKS